MKGYILSDNEISVLYFSDNEKPKIVYTYQKGDNTPQEYIGQTLEQAVKEDLEWYKTEGYDMQIKSCFTDFSEIEKIIKKFKNLY